MEQAKPTLAIGEGVLNTTPLSTTPKCDETVTNICDANDIQENIATSSAEEQTVLENSIQPPDIVKDVCVAEDLKIEVPENQGPTKEIASPRLESSTVMEEEKSSEQNEPKDNIANENAKVGTADISAPSPEPACNMISEIKILTNELLVDPVQLEAGLSKKDEPKDHLPDENPKVEEANSFGLPEPACDAISEIQSVANEFPVQSVLPKANLSKENKPEGNVIAEEHPKVQEADTSLPFPEPTCKATSEIKIVANELIVQPMKQEDNLTKESELKDSANSDEIPKIKEEAIFAPSPEPDSNVMVTNDSVYVKEEISNEVHEEITKTVLPSVPSPGSDSSHTSVSMEEDPEELEDSKFFKESSLSLLAAQYVSDSDSDDISEVPLAQTYQNRFVEIDSDSSSSDIECLGASRSPIDLDILGTGHSEADDEENTRNSRPPKVRGELHLDDLPPIQDLHITVPEEECSELGKVQSIIDQLVVVNSLPDTVPLDLDTVLFLDKGKQVLGEIFDVIGQVSDPLYCVRFNSNKEIKRKGIEVGQTVYVAPRTQHTQFIVLANLMNVRGSDASWENDVEPPPRFLDYSDDEEERTAVRTLRNRNRSIDANDDSPKRPRPAEYSSPSPSGYYSPRPPRGGIYGPVNRQPVYQHPSNYNIAGNSWHSNYYRNYPYPQQQYMPQQYGMPVPPVFPPGGFRHPPPFIPHRIEPPYPPQPPRSPHPPMVLNPYAVFPPPPLMQQPLFPPPPLHLPPPPPPQ